MAKTKSFVGIDIGTSNIKLVQLENYKGQPRLVTYGYAEAKVDIIRDESPELQAAVAKILQRLMKDSRATSTYCVAALPTFAVFSSIISLPQMSRRDVATAIKWEAKKFVPLPMEDMIPDWKILEGEKQSLSERLLNADVGSYFARKKKLEALGASPSDKKEPDATELATETDEKKKKFLFGKKKVPDKSEADPKKNLRVLLTAAPKTLVSRYVEIFKLANLDLLSLETEAFALARSLIGMDRDTVMVVDIGSSSTNICIIERGVPVLNRGLDLGGYNITKSIADSLNVNFDRAEQFKLDFGLMMQDESTNVPHAIKDSLQPIINEIQYIFDLYQNQGSLNVSRIVLSGGSAFLPNLTKYLSQLLHIPVYIGNPWDRIIYPLDLKPVLESVGPHMAVSIGLAMRNIS